MIGFVTISTGIEASITTHGKVAFPPGINQGVVANNIGTKTRIITSASTQYKCTFRIRIFWLMARVIKATMASINTFFIINRF